MAIETTDTSSTVIKRGEICIQANLQRDTSGLSINVKVHPRVEEFFRTIATGSLQDVRSFGRYWTPVEKDHVLNVYDIGSQLAMCHTASGSFRLDRPGAPLVEGGGDGLRPYGDVINLSFLRLQGASEGAGVSFRVNGVHTMEAIKNMRDRIGDAAQSFYVNYLRPIDLVVQISTQDIPR